jgi:uncharacterized membrane protein YgcG
MKICKVYLPFFLLVFMVPVTLIPGTMQDASEIVDRVKALYNTQIEREGLLRSVSKALDAGLPYEDILNFVFISAQENRRVEEVSHYLDTAARLHARDVPAGLVFHTLLEGFAKKIPEQTIRNSLASMEQRLVLCSEITHNHLGRRNRKSKSGIMIRALFNALNIGFEEHNIKGLSSAVIDKRRSPDYFLKVLEIMMELNTLALDQGRTVELIEESIKNGYTVREMASYADFFSSGLKRGLTAEELQKDLMAKVEQGEKPEVTSYQQGRTGGGTTSGGRGSGGDGSSGSGGASSSPGGSVGGGRSNKGGGTSQKGKSR